MKITFILPTVSIGGGVRVVAIYANELSMMGHEVLLVSPPPKELSFKEKIKHLIRKKSWPSKQSTKSHIDNTDVVHNVLDVWRPVIDSDVPDADVIIATWWETAEWVMGLSEKKGAKVYFIQHHEIHPYLPIERCKATYRLPLHKIVIAKWLKDVMSSNYNDKNVDLVPNSVDHSQFSAPKRNKQNIPTVGFLYSTSSYKGVDITLQVIRKLRRQFKNIRVISFGTIPPNLGNSDFSNIEFIHSPKQENIKDIYAQCDVWITSSITEGFNLPAMEAMACRTPLVSTKAGWPEEAIITGKNGVLADVNDVNALYEGAKMILSSSNDEWYKMSENAYKTVENSSWQKSALGFEAALERICLKSSK